MPRYKSTTLGTASRSNFKDKLPNAKGLRVFHWSHWVIAFVPFMFLSCSNCSVHGSYFAMSQSDILMMSMLQSNQRNSICGRCLKIYPFSFSKCESTSHHHQILVKWPQQSDGIQISQVFLATSRGRDVTLQEDATQHRSNFKKRLQRRSNFKKRLAT